MIYAAEVVLSDPERIAGKLAFQTVAVTRLTTAGAGATSPPLQSSDAGTGWGTTSTGAMP
ncbi:MAG TPA: hypothetical protein VIJ34_07640 [Acidimicrobiales bacterium]